MGGGVRDNFYNVVQLCNVFSFLMKSGGPSKGGWQKKGEGCPSLSNISYLKEYIFQ